MVFDSDDTLSTNKSMSSTGRCSPGRGCLLDICFSTNWIKCVQCNKVMNVGSDLGLDFQL